MQGIPLKGSDIEQVKLAKSSFCILVFQYDTHYGRSTGRDITAPLIPFQQVVFPQFPIHRYPADAQGPGSLGDIVACHFQGVLK